MLLCSHAYECLIPHVKAMVILAIINNSLVVER